MTDKRKMVSVPISLRGFTLIELLIAVSLTSILLVALYGAFFAVIKAQAYIDGALEHTMETGRFLDIFSREIRSSFFKETNSGTLFLGKREYSHGATGSQLTFTAITHSYLKEGLPAGDLITIRYSVAEALDGALTLYKEMWNPYTSKDGFKAEVIEDIEDFEISYFNGNDWVKTWDTTLEKRLPSAVKAVISVKQNGQIREFATIARAMTR